MLGMEVRERIVAAHERGETTKDICRVFGVGEKAVYRLLKLKREGKDIAPRKHDCGRKPELDEAGLQRLKRLVESRPDITLREIKEEMGLKIGIGAISVNLRTKLGFRFKKSRSMRRREIGRML